ncbi:MAG: leucine-rich repeat protein [Oscillospiraceae bacterium]|nr:leucine-rich repeat protein [Oscillospiraceae bacterium]
MYCYFCMKETVEQNGVCLSCGRTFARDTDRNHLLPGTMLKGKYMVGNVLGQGGFGITYAGRDTTLDIRIAIKEYYPTGHASRDCLSTNDVTLLSGPNEAYFANGKERFLTEAKALAKFNRSGNIVHARDFFELNNTAYIIMDFVEGKDLRHFLRENSKVEPQKLVDWFMPILNVLGKVHAEGLIHRDISPDNIIVENGELILIDFGAARDVEATKSLSVMLKPGYAPGEQYTSDRSQQGPWTDIYAVCATMYECITGVTPQESSSRLFEDHLQKPSQLGITIPPHIEAALMHGMANKYKDRPQNMQQLIAELSGAIAPAFDPDPKTVLMDDPKTVLMTQPGDMQVTGVEIGHLTTGVPAQTGELTKAMAAAPERAGKKKFIAAVAVICALLVLGGVGASAVLNRAKTEPSAENSTETTTTMTVTEAASAESTYEKTEGMAASETKPETTVLGAATTKSKKTTAVTTTTTDDDDDDETTSKSKRIRTTPTDGPDPDPDPDPQPAVNPPTPAKTTEKPAKTTEKTTEKTTTKTSKTTTKTTPKTTAKPVTTKTEAKTEPPTEPPVVTDPPRERQDLNYVDLTDGGVRICGFNQRKKNLEIPATLNGRPVTEIEEYAFQDETIIESVSLPDSLKSIGANAFDGCSKLRELTLPDSVEHIGDYAFADCGIEKLKLSNGMQDINMYAFYRNEKLKKVVIPGSVKVIGDYAFCQCTALEKVCIPMSVDKIGTQSFNGFPPIECDVYFSGSQPDWDEKDYASSAFYTSTPKQIPEYLFETV